MHPDPLLHLTRRHFLSRASTGIGAAAIVAGTVATVQDLSAQLSLGAALNAAANSNATNQGFSVFIFGGNTYAYVDTGANGLTDNDQLVQLSGTLNLDLLLQSGVIIA